MADIREEVRDRYADAARAVTERGGVAEGALPGCCGPDASASCCGDTSISSGLYDTLEQELVPETALLASLGCGNPTAVAELREGETVLDLGSGGGIDVLLSAHRVGPTGKVYGVDMTDEMLELALANKAEAGVDNVEFLKGYVESIPLPAGVVDVVISNCVINLAPDKAAVFAETFRVLKPGGRLGVSDIVAANELTPEDRLARGSYVGCIAGALSFAEYEDGLRGAGFTEISITPTHDVADGMSSTIIKAVKP